MSRALDAMFRTALGDGRVVTVRAHALAEDEHGGLELCAGDRRYALHVFDDGGEDVTGEVRGDDPAHFAKRLGASDARLAEGTQA